MRIDRLIMTGFGRFQGRTLELSPGLNLVVGPNEAGKTTIQKFILGMLYGFKKRGQRRDFTEDAMRYRPWQGGAYRGALVYTLQNGRVFRVEREFDPYREDVQLFDEVLGTNLTERFPRDRRKELLFAEEQFHLSEEVFRSTAWVGQLQVGHLELGKELLTRLANMQESGRDDLSVRDAILILEERARQIGTERAATRPYARLCRAIEEGEQRLQRASSAWEQVRRWEIRLAEARSSLAQIQEEQAELLRRLDWVLWRETEARLERVESISRRVNELKREAESLSRYAHFPTHQRDRLLRAEQEAQEAERRAAELGGADLPELEAEIGRLREQVAELENLMAPVAAAAEQGEEVTAQVQAVESRIAALKQAGESREAVLARERIATLRRERRATQGWMAAMAALALLGGAGAAYGLLYQPPGLLGYGMAGLALLALILLLVFLIRSRAAAARQEALKTQLEQALAVADEARRQLPELEEERRRLLRTVGAGSLGDVARAATRYQQIAVLQQKLQGRMEQLESRAGVLRVETDRAAKARAEVEMILAEAGVESVEQFETACTLAEAWAQADREARLAEEPLRSLLAAGETLEELDLEVQRLGARLTGDEPSEPRSATALQEEVRRLESQRADLSALVGDLAARVETGQADLPDVADLAQELDALRDQKAAYDEELAALQLAREAMEAAAEEIHRDFAPRLNAAMAQAVSELTGGRYRSVKVDENLNIRAIAEGDRTVDLLSLSGGTIDQFYLGLRLALLDVVQGAEPIPLMLDDPFVQYDDERVRQAMALLGHLSERHQVIFMTCHNREVQIARELGLQAHVVSLGPDSFSSDALEASR